MFNSFSDFKKNVGTFEALQKSISSLAKGGFEKKDDGNEWKPTADKADNGSAVIRFLPPPKGEDLPIAKLYSHGFQGGSGKWLIENCPTTINEPCPVCESNNDLWNASGEGVDVEENHLIVSGGPKRQGRKRKLQFTANILVVKDPKNPDAEGKVFRYSFGSRIMDKITGAMNPSQDRIELGETPIKVFDLWEGANFTLSFKKVKGQRNYDDSKFGNPSPAAGTDVELEAIWNQEHSLATIASKDKFKTYDELKKKRDFVLNTLPSAVKESVEPVVEAEEPAAKEAPQPKVKKEKASKVVKELEPEEAEDDDLAFYSGLANGK